MNNPLLLVLSVALAFSRAYAEELPQNLDGRWTAKVTVDNAQPYTSLVEIRGDTGTWKTLLYTREDPCVGRKSPIYIKPSKRWDLVFEIAMSEELRGCPDSTVYLNRTGPNQFEGKRGRRTVVLTRD